MVCIVHLGVWFVCVCARLSCCISLSYACSTRVQMYVSGLQPLAASLVFDVDRSHLKNKRKRKGCTRISLYLFIYFAVGRLGSSRKHSDAFGVLIGCFGLLSDAFCKLSAFCLESAGCSRRSWLDGDTRSKDRIVFGSGANRMARFAPRYGFEGC